MGSDFAAHAQAALFGLAHQLQAAGRGQVLDVQGAAGQLGQGDVPGNLDFLAAGRPAGQAQAGGYYAFVDHSFSY